MGAKTAVQPLEKTVTPANIESAKATIRSAMKSFESQRILVIGDVGLDEYLTGDVKRISPEAPVPVVEVKKREYRVGLAANVAQNIQSLGGHSHLVGLVGKDDSARELGQILKQSGVSDQSLIVDHERPTTRKVRVMSGQHHVVRVDFETKAFLTPEQERQLLDRVRLTLPSSAGLILQDYGKGVLSETLCRSLIRMAHDNGLRVVVDPHRTTPLKHYRSADLIKPNRDEAFVLSGLPMDDLHLNANSVHEVAAAIREQAQCQALIITQGSLGVTLYEGQNITQIPTAPRQVFDVTGAGDTYLAAFCLAWFSGLDSVTAAIMANFAAGVVVGKIGSVPCTKAELLEAMTTP